MKRKFKGGSASEVASFWIVIAHISFNTSETNHHTRLFYFNHFQPLPRWLQSLICIWKLFKHKYLNSKKYTTPMGAGDETLFLWNQNQWIHRSTKCVGGEKVCICWHTLKKIKVGDQTTCLPLYNTFPSFTSHQISKRTNKAFGLVWVCK